MKNNITPLIEIRKSNIGYKKSKPILKNVNLKIFKNDIVYLLGNNGTGKTTLIKAMCGLLKPIKGQIIYSKDLSYKQISYVSQTISFKYDLFVDDLITLTRLMHNIKEKQIVSCPIYKKLNINRYRHKRAAELSLGIQKQINLCLGLCWKPTIVFLDEFATNLDVKTTKTILPTIKQFCLKNKITIVATSHIPHELEIMQPKIVRIETKLNSNMVKYIVC